jgi:hypothetical protein
MKHADLHPTDSTSKPLSGQQIVLENPPNSVSVVIGLLALSR